MRYTLSRRKPEVPSHRVAGSAPRGWRPRLAAAALVLVAAGAAHASEGGLVLLPDFRGLLPALILFFALLILPVNRLILLPLLQVLDQRADRIEGARGRAERLVREAEELATRHRDSILQAREQAEQQRRQLLDDVRARVGGEIGGVRSEVEAEVERARAELAQALEEARVQLRGTAQELASQIATRILGRPLS